MWETVFFRSLTALSFLIAGAASALAGSDLSNAMIECSTAQAQHATSTASCDHYVDLATKSGDRFDIGFAYLTRALQHEYAGDVPAALADVEKASQVIPDMPLILWRRARLMAEGGDYDGAMKLFATLPKPGAKDDMDATLAMLAYVTGNLEYSVEHFQTAAMAAVSSDPILADYFTYNAAIIDSERKGGDFGVLAATGIGEKEGSLLFTLSRYHMGKMTDAELEALIPGMKETRSNACASYFTIGHHNAVIGHDDVARRAFLKAIDACPVTHFELHAARKWLKKLGS